MIEARPNHELIITPKHLLTAGGLDRATNRQCGCLGAVDGARNGAAQDVGNLVSIQAYERSRVVAEAQTWARIKRPRLAHIAVDVLLPEAADIGVAFHRPGIADAVAAGRIKEGELILVGLRRGVDRAPVPIEHLDRCRRQRAETVRRPGEIEMKFGLVAAHTDIRIDAAQFGGRALAPPAVVDRISRRIERNVVLLRTVLRTYGTPSKGADDALDLTAFVVEAVLHLDRDRATNRIQSEDRVAGKHIE